LLQLNLGEESLREVSRAVVQLFGMSAPFMKMERSTWELYFLHVIAACQRCEGSSLNDLVDTLLGQILPLQSDWASDMFPALLDCLMQKNPAVIQECEELKRLIDHLANNTSTTYRDALSIMALGSVQAMENAAEMVFKQWPPEDGFTSKAGATLWDYCEHHSMVMVLLRVVVQMLFSPKVEHNEHAMTLLTQSKLDSSEHVTEKDLGKLVTAITVWLEVKDDTAENSEYEANFEVIFRLKQNMIIPWLAEITERHPQMIMKAISPYPPTHMRVGPGRMLSPVLCKLNSNKKKHFNRFAKVAARFDNVLLHTLPVWTYHLARMAPSSTIYRTKGRFMNSPQVFEPAMGATLLELLASISKTHNEFVAAFPVAWFFTDGRACGCDIDEPWYTLFLFVRENVKLVEAEYGVDVEDRATMATVMRETSLKMLRLLVELGFVMPFHIYKALLYATDLHREWVAILGCLHVQLYLNPSMGMYEDVKPILETLTSLQVPRMPPMEVDLTHDTTKAEEEGFAARKAEQDALADDFAALSCSLLTVSISAEVLPTAISEHTKPRMMTAFMKERTKLSKAPNYIALSLTSPLVLQLLYFLKEGGFPAQVAVERMHSLIGDESGLVNKVDFINGLQPYMFQMLWGMLEEACEPVLSHVCMCIIYCIAADPSYARHTTNIYMESEDWRLRAAGSEKILMLLRYFADLGTAWEDLRGELEAFSGGNKVRTSTECGAMYEMLLKSYVDPEDLVRHTVMTAFTTMPNQHVSHIVDCLVAKFETPLGTKERMRVMMQLRTLNQIFPSTSVYKWSAFSVYMQPEDYIDAGEKDAQGRPCFNEEQILRYHLKGVCILLAFQMLANGISITDEELKKLFSESKLLLMNDEDSLFGAEVISSAFIEGLGWYVNTLDEQSIDDNWKTWVVRFVLDTAMISFRSADAAVPQGLLKAWLSLLEILLTSDLELFDVQDSLGNLIHMLIAHIQASRMSDDNCVKAITCMGILLRRNPGIGVSLLPTQMGMATSLLLKWKAQKKPRLLSQILNFLFGMFEIFGQTGIFLHIFKEPLHEYFGVMDEDLHQCLKLLLLSKRTPLTITTPIRDVVSRFFDQPLSSVEKMHLLRNTARYISHSFKKKDLPPDIIEEISTFIPNVIANLHPGAELATFSYCYYLALVVLQKGVSKHFFAMRRLVVTFRRGLESPSGYFPSDAVVNFAQKNMDHLDRAQIEKQLGVMFMSMFGWHNSPMDPHHVYGCLEALIRDTKHQEPLLTNSVNDFFPHLVSFMGRCNELGVARVDVMRKMAQYIVLQCKLTRSQWSHINASKPEDWMGALGQSGERRIPAYQLSARRLRMLTWVMLELTASQETDITVDAKHVEALAISVILGLSMQGHGQLNPRDTYALLTALNAVKTLFYFTQVITGSSEALVPMWSRLWHGLHHLLFDNSDILREEGMSQCGAIVMFFLFATASRLPMVQSCTPTWRAVCTMIQNKCTAFESKITSNVMFLAKEAEHYLIKAVRHNSLTKTEIHDRLLVDLRCMQQQADFLGNTEHAMA